MSVRILVFAKAPVPGKVKTRLIPALGEAGAAALAERMLDHTIEEALAAQIGLVELCTDPAPSDASWDRWRGRADLVSAQGEGDLGERLDRAARRAIEQDEKVLLIGGDCPELDRIRLRRAAESLRDFDAVIHPAADGGYALLGLARYDPSVFAEIAWSTDSVAQSTIAAIRALFWSLQVADTLHDVDEPADLERFGYST